ncbi:MAG TPA: hypothetical protein VEI52_04045, partial [Terriglobales bacterium]|nr:hypothetical protein [Terriglobales bacterium]
VKLRHAHAPQSLGGNVQTATAKFTHFHGWLLQRFRNNAPCLDAKVRLVLHESVSRQLHSLHLGIERPFPGLLPEES